MNGEAAVAPGSVATIARRNHVMQGNAATRSQGRRLTGSAIHPGHPPAPDNFGLGNVLQVNHAENVIGETIEMRCNGRVASAGPPQAIDSEARHFEKGDLPHLGRARNVVNAQARSEFLAVGNTISQRILEVTARMFVVRLHGHDIRAIGQQQQVVGNLQVMCPRKITASEEADRLGVAWIRGIKNRYSITEHVADIEMPAIEHDLNAVRPAANIAIRQMTEMFPDALRRNRSLLGGCLSCTRCQRRHTKETFPASAPGDRHVRLRVLNVTTSLHAFLAA